MTESRKGVFARNIFSNFAGYGVTVVCGLLLLPFLQGPGNLGGPTWGMWAFVVSMTGSYSLLDLGIRSAVGQYVTRYWNQGDMDGVNRTLNTAMIILIGVAVLAALVTVVLFFTLELWVDFDSLEDSEKIDRVGVRWALLISGLGISLSLPMALWATVTYARERFDISNGIGITETLFRTGLIYVVVSAGGGIIGLAIVTSAAQLLSWLARMLVAYRLMPGLRWSKSFFDRSSVKELASFGAYNVLVNIADKIVQSTDLVIISAVILSAERFYANGCILPSYYMQMVLMVTWTMTPYATACDTRGDRDALRRLLLNGTRGSMFLTCVIGAGILLVGDEFMHQYLGPTNLDSPNYASAGVIMTLLTWATLVRMSSSCGRQVLFGMRRMRLLAGLASVEAILNLGLSIVLIHFIGTRGVAIGTLLPIILIYGIIQNIYITRLLEVPLATYFGQFTRASVPVMLGMYLTHLWVDSWLIIDSWPSLGAKVGLLLVPAVAIGYLVVMNRDEREQLLQRLGRN